MPIYEYECTKCGRIEEVLQRFSDKPLTACNHCSGKLHKLISQSTFHLKGTGWYVSDYTNKTKDTSSASKPSNDTTSSDSTPAPTDKKTSKKASS